MSTLAQIRQRMYELEPSLGRTVAIASLGTKTITVTALKTGTIGKGKYLNKWLLRPDTSTTADRLRFSSDFNSGDGVIEHAGVDYGDTTATSENLEICEFEPTQYDLCIQESLRSTRFPYRHEVPARADGRYQLYAQDWITEPAHILNVGRRGVRVLTPNRHMEQWNGYDTSGNLIPDWFTLGGESGATYARSTTQAFRGRYTLDMTRAGTDCTVTLTIDLNETGVSADSLRGETVTGVLVASGDGSSSTATIKVTDGVDTSTGSTGITNSTARQEISVEHTVNTSATTLQVVATGTADGDIYLDEMYGVFGSLDDTIRRDVEAPTWEQWTWFQQGQPLLMHSNTGRGTQVVIESRRPYAMFDSDRILAGTADADVSDAPIDLIAYGALAKFFENRAAAQNSSPNEAVNAAKYRGIYARLQSQHFYRAEQQQGVTEQLLSSRPQGRIARLSRY